MATSKEVGTLSPNDIVFVVINESLNRTEGIAHGYQREAKTLLNLVEKMSGKEVTEVMRRLYIAKDIAIHILAEIEDKKGFAKSLYKLATRSSLTYETISKITFLQGRCELQQNIMNNSDKLIDIAMEKYSSKLDISITRYNKKLNKILLVFTFITILFLPVGSIGGIMGMNIKVPYQDEDSLVAFSVIISFLVFCMIAITIVLRCINWI